MNGIEDEDGLRTSSSADDEGDELDYDESDDDYAGSSADYVLPDSDTRKYTRSELESMSDKELYVARNEIYARNGRSFKSPDLRSYFGSKDWYSADYDPEDFDNWFTPNAYEKYNSDLIAEIEHERNSPYLP